MAVNEERNKYRMKLISLVNAQPILWDKTGDDFANRSLKPKIWKNIADELNVSSDRVRRTWENLRDQFRREFKRSQDTGTPAKWLFYEPMEFIRPMVRLQKDDSTYHPQNPNGVRAFNENNVNKDRNVGYDNNENSSEEPEFEASQFLISEWREEPSMKSEETSNLRRRTRKLPQRPEYKRNSPVNVEKIVIHESDEHENMPAAYADTSMLYETSSIHLSSNNVKIEYGSDSDATEAPYVSTSSAAKRARESVCRTRNMHDGYVPESYSTEIQDEDYHFVMSLLPSLRRITGDSRKLMLRMRLLNAISETITEETSSKK